MKPSLFLGAAPHQDILQLLKARKTFALSGASNETAKALIIAFLFEMSPRKMVFVVPDEKRCTSYAQWLSFFEVPTQRLPDSAESTPLEEVRALLSFFVGDSQGVLLLTEEMWGKPLPSLREMEARKVELSSGEKCDMTALFESLMERGYRHGQDLLLAPGEYRKIGDVLSIFPIQAEHPFQALFSFETIESLRSVDAFDPSKSAPVSGPLVFYPTLSQERLRLGNQMPEEALLILDELEEGQVPANVPTLSFTAFPEATQNHLHVRYLSVLKFYTLPDFLNDVRDKLEQGWSLLVVTKRSTELQEVLTEERIRFAVGGQCTPGTLTVFDAATAEVLPHSLQNPDLHRAMLTDREIFSLRKEGKQRSIQKLALDFITSLQPGDFVVHMDHGIGRFEGIVQKTVDSITREYLELQYAGTDRLFTPIDQADKLSKYVHEEGQEPELNKLGGVEWKRTTGKIREEAKKAAKELLDLYAKRAKAKGFAYPPDTDEQKRFEAAFPYPETPGQLKAIQDIKHDMEDPHPMDRLLCGDVGFGKTEVALRAAFKAVQAGKQVAFVSPITILADQHYRTLQKRAEGFRIRMEMLSRFRSPAEQKERS